jgi:capsular exopolysaccharide synthesis family protein
MRNDEPDLHRYLRVLRADRLLIIATTIVVVAGAVAFSLVQSPRYRATSVLLYAPSGSTQQANQDFSTATQINTLVHLATTDATIAAAATTAKADPQALKSAIVVAGQVDTSLIDVTATAGTAKLAAGWANALVDAFVKRRVADQRAGIKARITSLQSQIDSLKGSSGASDLSVLGDLRSRLATAEQDLAAANGDLVVVERATPPSAAFAPQPVRNAIIALFAGLLLGIVAATARDRLNRRLRTVEQIEEAYGLPTIGIVPAVQAAVRGKRHEALGDFSGTSPLVNAFRTMRTYLSLLADNPDSTDGRVIVVTSAVAAEGKSGVCANLGVAFASSGRRVLAISCDLRAPTLHQYFNEVSSYGLLTVLASGATVKQAAQVINLDGITREDGFLAILANDQLFPDPAVLFESPSLGRVIDEARKNYDIVILDSPPVLVASETIALGRQADVVLMVAKLGSVTRDDARRALQRLRDARLAPFGLVVTAVNTDPYGVYGYGGN